MGRASGRRCLTEAAPSVIVPIKRTGNTLEQIFKATYFSVGRQHLFRDDNVPWITFTGLCELNRNSISHRPENVCKLFRRDCSREHNCELDVTWAVQIVTACLHSSKDITVLVIRERQLL
jgi:hypothetical protein